MHTYLIISYNDPNEAVRQAEFARERLDSAWQVVILDNFHSQESSALLEKVDPRRVRVLRTAHQNLGWGCGVNFALQHLEVSDVDWLMVSAQDTEWTGHSLEELVENALALQTSTVGTVCPQYDYEPMSARYSPLRGVYVIAEPNDLADEMHEVQVPHGSACLFRVGPLKNVGGFDSRFFLYGDESEIGLRLQDFGFKNLCFPKSTIKNPRSTSTRPLITYYLQRNALLTVRLRSGLFWSALAAARAVVGAKVSRADSETKAARLRAIRDFFKGRLGAATTFT